MDYNLLVNLEACRDALVPIASLVYYSHLPAIAVSLLFSVYVFLNRRDLPGILLVIISLLFVTFMSFDFYQYVFTDQGTWIMLTWSVLGLLAGLQFFFLNWFVRVMLGSNTFPVWMLIVWGIALLPILLITPTTYNLVGYDVANCQAFENTTYASYYYGLGVLAMVLIAISAFSLLRKKARNAESVAVGMLTVIGTELFIFAFLATGVIASYLVEAGIIADFGIDQYGLATMTVFIGMLVYATVRYHAFNLKLVAAQALVVALVILVASEYLFVVTLTSKILVTLTLGLAIVFGYTLIRSVMSEIRQREHIQKLADDLKEINTSQEALMHFIGHEVKGSLTKALGGFDAIASGGIGDAVPDIKKYAERAMGEMEKGVAMVTNILDAANLKEGKMEIKKEKFDFVVAVNEITSELRHMAEDKHLSLSVSVPPKPAMILGDKEKLIRHTLRNLIENAIYYSPTGSIVVLTKIDDAAKHVIFSVTDTGVGITAEDMKKLFKPGGRGKDSTRVNAHSTGFGLSIAKGIVEAHSGTITASSQGAGKGSTFTVTLPLAK